jgi:hypothetical protein
MTAGGEIITEILQARAWRRRNDCTAFTPA